MKIRVNALMDFKQVHQEDSETYNITSRIYTINNQDELKQTVNNMASDIAVKIENSQIRKSGYIVDNVNLDIAAEAWTERHLHSRGEGRIAQCQNQAHPTPTGRSWELTTFPFPFTHSTTRRSREPTTGGGD